MKVIVCGGGVIGAATAFFLARRGVAATVFERAGVASCASGKSGGFLAEDWCDGTPLEALARRSFALHAALAAEGTSEWGYRRLSTFAGSCDALASISAGGAGQPADTRWIARDVEVRQQLGSPATTAQIHPAAFTRWLMRMAEADGASLQRGNVTGLRRDASGAVTGVKVDGKVHDADAVVIAMGPWSSNAAAWIPLPEVYGVKGHSLIYGTPGIPPEALFLDVRTIDGSIETPEIFPRPDGTTYVCAISSDDPVPEDPAAVGPDSGAYQRLAEICQLVCPALQPGAIIARQACFRPVTIDGLPLIGAIDGAAGAYVATGHSVWGMLNGPATGEAVAELILDGRTSAVDISAFTSSRFGAVAFN